MHPFIEGFVGFRERDELEISRRNLPHWEQDGATYFVTMRLADSVPESVLADWNRERTSWLSAHGATPETLHCLDPEERANYHQIFSAKLHDYIDRGYGECHLNKPKCQQIVAGALHGLDGERYALGDFVIMPNHVHLLMRPLAEFTLRSICYGLKRFTARECNRALGQAGHFWQTESYDRIIRDQEELSAFRRYIHANPEKAKLREGDYLLHHIGDAP